MDQPKVVSTSLKDLTIDNITGNVILVNYLCEDPRMKYVLERLVTHLHDFARETRLSTSEWMARIEILTKDSQICSDVRQEFILLSDVLGLSLLVDSIDHPKPLGSTDGTVLGPFHTHEAPEITQGGSISHDANGEPLLVLCTLKDVNGKPIPRAKVDVWETDSSGHYDVQHPDRRGPDGRGVIQIDHEGCFWFKAIKPVPYPIPNVGPVGKLLAKLQRHPYRPSHMHFMFDKEGYDPLITALYLRNDPCETSDAVFGVKNTLVVDLDKVDAAKSGKYDVPEVAWLMTYDFVLVVEEESSSLRIHNSQIALEKLGRRVQIVNGVPIPDVD